MAGVAVFSATGGVSRNSGELAVFFIVFCILDIFYSSFLFSFLVLFIYLFSSLRFHVLFDFGYFLLI